MRGILDFNKIPYASVTPFIQLYTRKRDEGGDVVDLDNPLPSPGAELPCVAAMEFLADVYEREGGNATAKAVEVRPCYHRELDLPLSHSLSKIWKALANDKDTIRKK